MYCEPLSEWWITPSGRRRESAIASAASTSSVRMCVAMASRRRGGSRHRARRPDTQPPAQVGTYVMSATHSSSGRGREVPPHHVRPGASPRVPARRRRPPAPPRHALDPQPPHQPPHPLLAHPLALRLERRVDPRAAVRLPALGPDRPDPLLEILVPPRPPRRRTLQPVVVPAGGETQHPGTWPQAETQPVRLHERISPPGIDPLSLANQAAAFFRMSRSTRSACCPASGATTSAAPPSSARPRDAPRPDPPAGPSSGSSARRARTPEPETRATTRPRKLDQLLPILGRISPRSSRHGTPPSLAQMERCPSRRGNSNS